MTYSLIVKRNAMLYFVSRKKCLVLKRVLLVVAIVVPALSLASSKFELSCSCRSSALIFCISSSIRCIISTRVFSTIKK